MDNHRQAHYPMTDAEVLGDVLMRHELQRIMGKQRNNDPFAVSEVFVQKGTTAKELDAILKASHGK